MRIPLPIDAALAEVRAALEEHGAVVLEAPPGSVRLSTRDPHEIPDTRRAA